jgi:hypothetical protein
MRDPLCILLWQTSLKPCIGITYGVDIIHTDLQDPFHGRKCIPRRKSLHMGDGDFTTLEFGLQETCM